MRTALYSVVGEATLKDLVAEARANEAALRQRVRTILRSSYSAHYRRMLPGLLQTLEFACNNSAYRPVMDALDLLGRCTSHPGRERYYASAETASLDGVVPREWRDAVVDEGGRVERIPYELCVLKALREAIRRREVYVVGANRWQNPDDDLPADFEANRDIHYEANRQPLDPSTFVATLQGLLHDGLEHLDQALVAGSAVDGVPGLDGCLVAEGAECSRVVGLFVRPPAWGVLAQALNERRRVLARYHGHERVICPHLLGFSGKRAKLLAYQCGGSTSGGSLAPDASRRWRSMFVDEIEQPVIIEGSFESAENFCGGHAALGMDHVELVVAAVDHQRPGELGRG